MSKSPWRKKPISAYQAEMKKSELNRVLGRWGLTSLGIGAIIGGGIFTLTGIAAHDHAGPALALSFVIAGVGCLFASLCYAEFSSVLPVEGSAYAYSYGTMGEIFAWIIGWNLILEYMMGATTVAVAWSGYFEKLLHQNGIDPPMWLMNDPVTAAEKAADAGVAAPAFAFNLPALLITWVVTSILIKGIKEAAKTNNLIVILKVAVVLFVPFAIVMSLVICTILYIIVPLVLTGMVKYNQLDLKAPVASAFEGVGMPWATVLITIAAVAGLTSVMLVMMLGQTRIFLGMAKDGLLPPKIFGKIHPKYKTPYISTILVGLVVSIVAAVTPIDKVSEMCSMGTLLAFSMISIAVVVLRVKQPNLERPFKTPALFIIGPLGALFNIGLMYFVRPETWVAFLIWTGLGVVVYFLYSRRKSNLNDPNYLASLKGHDGIVEASENLTKED